MHAKSLYIHIPFCRRKCLYCDFYSIVYDDNLAVSYVDIIVSQLGSIEKKFSTVYIGGGTPTSLNRRLLERLLKAARLKCDNETEFTVEANPESIDEEKLKTLLDCGVNRLSIGIQSLDERKLKKLGRIHDAAKAADSVILALRRGFKNISADLIFGLWSETLNSWQKELDEALSLPLKHLSCYSLTYEKNTPLFFALQNKSVEPLEDETVAAMYEYAIERLSLRGFKQ
ncbi:MAG: radical SAM family heme chaperone HemW, partial [Candidatus Omnitrophica bacterium]|nr:radical SAM family heme chaperone HemW [Candidatus Omnitrophota bacterium]